ncbi:hypothetical protein ACF0H5_024327 [Mactra antiquata]
MTSNNVTKIMANKVDDISNVSSLSSIDSCVKLTEEKDIENDTTPCSAKTFGVYILKLVICLVCGTLFGVMFVKGRVDCSMDINKCTLKKTDVDLSLTFNDVYDVTNVEQDGGDLTSGESCLDNFISMTRFDSKSAKMSPSTSCNQTKNGDMSASNEGFELTEIHVIGNKCIENGNNSEVNSTQQIMGKCECIANEKSQDKTGKCECIASEKPQDKTGKCECIANEKPQDNARKCECIASEKPQDKTGKCECSQLTFNNNDDFGTRCNNDKSPRLSWQLFCLVTTVICGLLFGFCLGKGRVFEPKSIRDQFVFESFIMLKIFLSAVCTGQLVFCIISMIPQTKHVYNDIVEEYLSCFESKGIVTTVLGSVILGTGMALAGACPGVVLAQVGAWVPNSIFTFLGCLIGALSYGLVAPVIEKYTAPNKPFKNHTIHKTLNWPYIVLSLPMAMMLFVCVFVLEYFWDYKKDLQNIEVSEQLTVCVGNKNILFSLFVNVPTIFV